MYDLDPHVAEIYDKTETKTEDVALIRRLIGARQRLRLLEPFCGTGRILLPLAHNGHTVVGLDRAQAMLDHAAAKMGDLPLAARERITVLRADVLQERWPRGFDLVILGGNCLYELATPQEQARVIAPAAAALRRGGHLFVDNDHMEGALDPSWYEPLEREAVFPSGECADGTRFHSRLCVTWYDAPRRLIRFRRRTRVTLPDGKVVDREIVQQKHPVSAREVAEWLTDEGLVIEGFLGDYEGCPHTDAAPRAMFWSQRGVDVREPSE